MTTLLLSNDDIMIQHTGIMMHNEVWCHCKEQETVQLGTFDHFTYLLFSTGEDEDTDSQ